MGKERLTDEELDKLLDRVRGDEKGTIYHQYFLALRELKDRRREEKYGKSK